MVVVVVEVVVSVVVVISEVVVVVAEVVVVVAEVVVVVAEVVVVVAEVVVVAKVVVVVAAGTDSSAAAVRRRSSIPCSSDAAKVIQSSVLIVLRIDIYSFHLADSLRRISAIKSAAGSSSVIA